MNFFNIIFILIHGFTSSGKAEELHSYEKYCNYGIEHLIKTGNISRFGTKFLNYFCRAEKE